MKLILLLLVMLLAIGASAQSKSCFPHCHQCEIYAADIASKKILQKVEFSPLTGEEELTNKLFLIPGTKLMVIASVFYTDESMASKAGQDSMQLALAVSHRSWPDAFRSPNNVITEITMATFDTARIHTSVLAGSRRLLVSIECKDTSSK